MSKKTNTGKKGNAIQRFRSRLEAFVGDADEKIEKGEDKGGDLAAAVKAIKDALPLLEAVEGLKAVGESPDLGADEDIVMDAEPKPGEGEDEDDEEGEGKKKGEGMDGAELQRFVTAAINKALAGVKPANAMDAADVYADMSKRDKLASRLSEFVGTFDHAEMTAQQVAVYGVEKLGLTVAKGSELVAVESYLHGRKAPREQAVAAMDAKEKTKPADWLTSQIK